MKELLSSKDLRLLTIVEFILENPFTTLTEISSKTNISVRTVSSSISKINDLISPCFLEANYLGVKLHLTANTSPRYILKQFLSLSLELCILETIFKEPNISISEIAAKHYVSEHTVRRSISHLNKVLIKKGFQINQPFLSFSGDYQAAVIFFILFLDEKYDFIDNSMSHNELRAIKYIVDNSLLIKNKIQNKQDYSRVILWTYVKSKIFISYEPFIDITYQFTLENFNEAQNLFEIAFNYPLTNQLLTYCFSFALTNDYALNYSHLVKQAQSNEIVLEIIEKLNKFITVVSEKFELNLLNKESLLVDMYNMISFPSNYSYILYSRDATFLSSLSNEITPLYFTSRKYLIQIFRNSINEHKINALLYLLFTHWREFISSIRVSRDNLRLGIYTDSDREHANMVFDILSSNFSYGLDIEIIETIYLKDLLHTLNSFDILITNVPNLSHSTCKIICFNEYPSFENWAQLYNEINSHIYNLYN